LGEGGKKNANETGWRGELLKKVGGTCKGVKSMALNYSGKGKKKAVWREKKN